MEATDVIAQRLGCRRRQFKGLANRLTNLAVLCGPGQLFKNLGSFIIFCSEKPVKLALRQECNALELLVVDAQNLVDLGLHPGELLGKYGDGAIFCDALQHHLNRLQCPIRQPAGTAKPPGCLIGHIRAGKQQRSFAGGGVGCHHIRRR